jgi:hypothetical protein
MDALAYPTLLLSGALALLLIGLRFCRRWVTAS